MQSSLGLGSARIALREVGCLLGRGGSSPGEVSECDVSTASVVWSVAGASSIDGIVSVTADIFTGVVSIAEAFREARVLRRLDGGAAITGS